MFQRFDPSKLSICGIETFQLVNSTNWYFQVSSLSPIECCNFYQIDTVECVQSINWIISSFNDFTNRNFNDVTKRNFQIDQIATFQSEYPVHVDSQDLFFIEKIMSFQQSFFQLRVVVSVKSGSTSSAPPFFFQKSGWAGSTRFFLHAPNYPQKVQGKDYINLGWAGSAQKVQFCLQKSGLSWLNPIFFLSWARDGQKSTLHTHSLPETAQLKKLKKKTIIFGTVRMGSGW